MPLPTTQANAAVLASIQSLALNVQTGAQSAKTTLQQGSVDTNFIFRMLDQLNASIASLNAKAVSPGLNAYATANIPGYAGTMTADITTTVNAAQACINWVTTTFPKDSTGNFILSETLNADGTRTLRQFTSAQTAQLQTLLQTLIASIA